MHWHVTTGAHEREHPCSGDGSVLSWMCHESGASAPMALQGGVLPGMRGGGCIHWNGQPSFFPLSFAAGRATLGRLSFGPGRGRASVFVFSSSLNFFPFPRWCLSAHIACFWSSDIGEDTAWRSLEPALLTVCQQGIKQGRRAGPTEMSVFVAIQYPFILFSLFAVYHRVCNGGDCTPACVPVCSSICVFPVLLMYSHSCCLSWVCEAHDSCLLMPLSFFSHILGGLPTQPHACPYGGLLLGLR